ncbi:antibiotic biosynthesis monooxygenase [Micromonospora rosaria]|uniref:Antibiotic biosynthesis monooxygenase n=1 Tax=Micromonospora rosaria TaxID=47874 RepID=A0A136PZE5_9ACTN|nr:antibiotic biosynthesis monooxygenase family protein [Micromonospora rosaria]KXK63820.1 antibiotic biosynthesis monooxygenase [Micromonospora rosaria]
MTGRARVIVYLRAPQEGPGAIEKAYHEISGRLAATPGLLRNELMRSTLDPGGFAVLSEWSSLADFRAWEEGAAHRNATSPLRPYQDRDGARHYGIYEIVAAY